MTEAEYAAITRLRQHLATEGTRALVAAVVRPTPGAPLVQCANAGAGPAELRAAAEEFLRQAAEQERNAQQNESQQHRRWWMRD